MNIRYLCLVMVAGMINAHGADIDPQTLRELRASGQIIALEVLLERHKAHLNGTLLDLEVEEENGRLCYELEIQDKNGTVREYLIDARSGEWLGEED